MRALAARHPVNIVTSSKRMTSSNDMSQGNIMEEFGRAVDDSKEIGAYISKFNLRRRSQSHHTLEH